jgi:hypothetical protein
MIALRELFLHYLLFHSFLRRRLSILFVLYIPFSNQQKHQQQIIQVSTNTRNGTSFPALTLYADGGVPRFLPSPSLHQGPSVLRNTAANTGILTALNSLESTKDVNVALKPWRPRRCRSLSHRRYAH